MRYYSLQQEGPGIPDREELSGGGHGAQKNFWATCVVLGIVGAVLLRMFLKHVAEENQRKEASDLANWQKMNRVKH